MRATVIPPLVLLELAAPAAADDDERLDGKWVVESVIKDGKRDDTWKGAIRHHTGDRYLQFRYRSMVASRAGYRPPHGGQARQVEPHLRIRRPVRYPGDRSRRWRYHDRPRTTPGAGGLLQRTVRGGYPSPVRSTDERGRVTRKPLRDHEDEASRRCRFCSLGEPEVTFEDEAHAFPDFMGNQSFFSMNECDGCNQYFGVGGCEDHLGKLTHLLRTLTGIPRKKKRKSTFKGDDGLRIDSDGCGGIAIHVPAPHSLDDVLVDGKLPKERPLVGDTASQKYVPIEAAKALVKIACSVCPKEDLAQCQGAIDWVRGRRACRFEVFPVLYAFTPGCFDERVSHVRMLRRKGEGAEPYFWCVVQFRNSRFQVPVPFCPADESWFGKNGTATPTFEHFPSTVGPDWPLGPTTFDWDNWAGTEHVRTSMTVTHHCDEVIEITRPGQDRTEADQILANE